MKNIFEKFTNQYSLSKTLRFELKPVGKTLENMRKRLVYDKDLQTFLKDQQIEDAYQTLKPLFDAFHEEFITDSLMSYTAQNIDFSKYLADYKEKRELKKTEDDLRKKFDGAFQEAGEKWKKEKYPKYGWKKGKEVTSGANILSCQDILQLIKEKSSNNEKIKEIVDETFKGFFTYFAGFNQNRENYYETKEEKATAVASRIVHENLPKFCDNLIQFDGVIEKKERKSEYLNAYKYLKDNGKTAQIKNAKNGKTIEAVAISENIFKISHFSLCLSQNGIEEYNRIIGHYNLLINLYNQAKRAEEKDLEKNKKTFKDLPKFKTLWKQIGCGKKKVLFFTLTHDKKVDAVKARSENKEAFSAEEVLFLADKAGKKYFQGKSDDGIINTIPEFIEYISGKENFDGVYWSKAAMNTISNKYFANYHDLKDRLKKAKVFQKPNKGREEDVKIPEVIELSGLFTVLDATADWQATLFKKSILEDEKKAKIIQETKTPSKALLKMIFGDIEENTQQFLDFSDMVLELKDYKSKESKETIKQWIDHALAVNQMLNYFLVKESKAKGVPVDPVIAEALNALIRTDDAEWFKWYDALRNYLTKKPQDDAKKNKLRLNFENNGSFLGGFVDSHTDSSDNATQYGGYIFRKWNDELKLHDYLLGVSQDKKLFRCHLKDEVQKKDQSDFERLEYYQVKSTTFFSEQYSANKKKLVECLSLKIKEKIKAKKSSIVGKKELKEINDLEKKILKPNTPTGLIEIVSKREDFLDIFEHKDFQTLVSETINEIMEYAKNYQERATRLKEIQEKQYIGHFGFKNLIDDLQTIAKEQKEYSYFPVNQKEFEKACNRNEKPLYVFQITNKDLAKKKETYNREKEKTGKNSEKNLHTLYFEKMLAGNQTTFDIGSGEIFYRKQAIKENKIKKGYEQKPWVIESKRFTGNKELEINIAGEDVSQGKSFFLHLSLKLNYTKSDKYKNPNFSSFENFTNTQLSSSPNIHFLGIDRGEKHLAYFCLVDQNGKIVGQESLNLPFTDKDVNPRSIKKEKYFYDNKKEKWESKLVDCWDYNDLLDAMSSNRDMARKNWQTIGTIKELKVGYISQVVRKIADIAVLEKHPAFIVLEDLNTGFKRERQKIEKSVYQKLELALVKKLNFLVDKRVKTGEIGSATKALQLTPPVNNYSDIENKKQVGIMFYTRANYTSQTDPLTGWRKKIYLQSGPEETTYTKDGKIKNKSVKDQIIEYFSDIYFDEKDYVFVYTDKKTGKEWELYSGINGKSLDRFRGKRGDDKYEWKVEPIDVVKDILDKVFIKFNKNKSLLEQIRNGTDLVKINEHTSWESLRFAIDLIQQIRNTGKNEDKRDNDFLLSPARDKKTGKHFDSREHWDKEQKKEEIDMPSSGDANGAFNIARKGMLMNAHIKGNSDSKDLNLFISDEEWDLYLADKKAWKQQLPKFSSRKAMEKEKIKKI